LTRADLQTNDDFQIVHVSSSMSAPCWVLFQASPFRVDRSLVHELGKSLT